MTQTLPASSTGGKSPRILAVDDQPANLQLLRRTLAPAGFEVREARSGGEALAVAREMGPDLILLDMHLPDMHGLEVLRRLRASAWGTGLRVVAMSALASPEDQAQWVQAGCVGTIEKPITVATFVQEVSRWLPGGSPGPQGTRESEQPKTDRLGEILVANALITQEQLTHAMTVHTATGRRLGQILVEQGAVSEDDIAWALSNQLGYPYVFLTREIIDEEAARLLPESVLRERRVLPILKFGEEMTLAMADPTDQRTVDEVVARTGLQVTRALALASNIGAMLDRLFARRQVPDGQTPTAEAQYLQFHFVQALQQEASEIHFDPGIDGQARIRYRLQGVLADRPAQPAELHAAILRHLRDLTGMDDRPSGSGTASLRVGDIDLHLMAAFLPTAAGPAAAVTFHPRRTEVPDLAALGVSAEHLDLLRQVLQTARGVVLVGCPDGWLRSTLLHALIPPLPGGKIWTLEILPIYHRPTLHQTPLRSPGEVAAHMYTAAEAGTDLIVADDVSRSDALVAAHEIGRTRVVLAGHPQDDVVGLLSQILSAAGSALVASTLRGIMAVRTVRLLCSTCKQVSRDDSGVHRSRQTFAPQGCEACGFTGFRGQRAMTEAWVMDPEARRVLRIGQVAALFDRMARTVGAQMREQGQVLVEDGLVSPEELARVLEDSAWISPTSSS